MSPSQQVDMSQKGNYYQMMIKIASVLLIMQNLSILAVLNFADETDLIISIIMFLDLIGFSLLAVGFYQLSREYEQYRDNFLIAAGGIIGWLVNRLFWQFSAGVETITKNQFALPFALAAIFLFLSGFSRLNNEYFLFSSVNLVAVLLIVLGWDSELATFGVYLKVFVVPFFAILAMWSLYSNKFKLLALPYPS